MKPKSSIRRWQEAPVEPSGEHLLLTCAPHGGADWSDYFPVARIGRPIRGAVSVEFLVDRSDPKLKEAVAKVIKQIEFYLIDKREPDAWGYACYHCGTLANAYSDVHWSCFRPERDRSR